MNGWVKFHRKVLENIFLYHDNNAFLVFAKLLLLVNQNGQWSGGRKQLAKSTNLNERTLYGVLQRLAAQQIININANSHYSVITICNWANYQQPPNKPANSRPTAGQQPRNTLARIKNQEKEVFDAPNLEKIEAARSKCRDVVESIRNRHLANQKS